MQKILLSAMAASLLSANETELQSLKNQMAQMLETMKAMQSKIDAMENAQQSALTIQANEPVSAVKTPKLITDYIPSIGQTAKSNLDLSIILDASYVTRSKKDEELSHLGIPSIVHSLIGSDAHDEHNHATYDASNGFNFNYAEMGLNSTVDPYLDATAFLHFYDGGVEIEEAYFTSRNLPYNMRLRGGKFLSDFGRQNNQHHHAWSFADMPLVYEAFLGNHGIQEIGAQLQWIVPTDNYLMFGIEALQGKNEYMFGNGSLVGSDDSILASSSNQPSLLVGYVKTSTDLDNTTFLAGASIANGQTRTDHLDEGHGYAGDSKLYGLDLTVKHYFDSYSSLTWQSEWLYRDMKGTEFDDDGLGTITSESLNKKQAGYYTQLVYAPDQSWRMGLKYDNIYQNDVNGISMSGDIDQYSAMVEYHTSEFARYRLQYTHSNALFNEASERQNLDSLIFSVNIAMGRHNAHPF